MNGIESDFWNGPHPERRGKPWSDNRGAESNAGRSRFSIEAFSWQRMQMPSPLIQMICAGDRVRQHQTPTGSPGLFHRHWK
jgi:hypothetical protein